jgi:diguanylate cyclase
MSQSQPPTPAASRDARIVIVDDEALNSQDLASFLRRAGHAHVVAMKTHEVSVQTLREECADLVLLEMVPGDERALALLQAMRADRHMRHVPVVTMCTQDDLNQRLRALALGAVDLLVRPMHGDELQLRLRNALATKAYRDQLAHTDPLTGLPNRDLLLLRTDWALRQAIRHFNVGAVLHLGLDRFQDLNNALGASIGDELLHAVGERLARSLRDSDMLVQHDTTTSPNSPSAAIGIGIGIGTGTGTGSSDHSSALLARASGDEFSVLLPRIERAEDAAVVAQRMISALQAPFEICGHELFVTCRVGMAVFPSDSADRDTVWQHAHVAMRSARRGVGGLGGLGIGDAATGCAFQYYSAALHSQAVHRLTIERELRQALAQGELRLHFQPQVDLHTGHICGAEALVRWLHPRRGLLGPGEFIAVAEETGLIGAIGDWVLRQALAQWVSWAAQGWVLSQIAVNVSGLQLQQAGWIDQVRAALTETGANPRALCLELTETAIIDSHSQVAHSLQAIRALGVQLALDDFGTGYSSLTYLRRFEIDELKIDRSFIADCDADKDSTSSAAAITAAIVVMARRLGLRVVAEGVETAAQLAFIRAQGAHSFQGYLFSKPLSAPDFTALLNQPLAAQRLLHAAAHKPALAITLNSIAA